MKYAKFIPASFVLILAAQPIGNQTLPPKVLNIKMRSQQTSKWCWAASLTMILETLGKAVRQCDQVNTQVGRKDCCNDMVPGACVKTRWPDFDAYGFRALRTSNKALTWDQLTKEIDNRRPVAFSWKYDGGSGHMMVLRGYAVQDGKKLLYVSDPAPRGRGKEMIITYSSYVEGSGYSHWDDFYDIRKKS